MSACAEMHLCGFRCAVQCPDYGWTHGGVERNAWRCCGCPRAQRGYRAHFARTLLARLKEAKRRRMEREDLERRSATKIQARWRAFWMHRQFMCARREARARSGGGLGGAAAESAARVRVLQR